MPPYFHHQSMESFSEAAAAGAYRREVLAPAADLVAGASTSSFETGISLFDRIMSCINLLKLTRISGGKPG